MKIPKAHANLLSSEWNCGHCLRHITKCPHGIFVPVRRFTCEPNVFPVLLWVCHDCIDEELRMGDRELERYKAKQKAAQTTAQTETPCGTGNEEEKRK